MFCDGYYGYVDKYLDSNGIVNEYGTVRQIEMLRPHRFYLFVKLFRASSLQFLSRLQSIVVKHRYVEPI